MAIRISATVNRTLVVLLAFFAAVLGGAVTLFVVGSRWAAQEVATQMPEQADEGSRFFGEVLGMFAFLFTVGPVLTLLPAVVVVVLGEVARIRSLLFYVVAGGMAAAAMPIISSHPEAAEAATYNAPYVSIMATAGFAAGFIYWLIAGRES